MTTRRETVKIGKTEFVVTADFTKGLPERFLSTLGIYLPAEPDEWDISSIIVGGVDMYDFLSDSTINTIQERLQEIV